MNASCPQLLLLVRGLGHLGEVRQEHVQLCQSRTCSIFFPPTLASCPCVQNLASNINTISPPVGKNLRVVSHTTSKDSLEHLRQGHHLNQPSPSRGSQVASM